MTNAQRQRDFRRRNPDYYRLFQAKRRAESKARVMAMRLEARKVAEPVVRKEPLMLPAPVETIDLPGIISLPTRESIAALAEQRAEQFAVASRRD